MASSSRAGLCGRVWRDRGTGRVARSPCRRWTTDLTPVAGSDSQPDLLGAVNPALTYLMLDGFAFFPNDIPGDGRIYQDITGVQPATVNRRLSAALPIPCGSTIYQLNVAYQRQPIMEIWKRSMTAPTPFGPALQVSVPLGMGASTTTIDLDPPLFVEQGTTVSVRFFADGG